MALGKVCLWVSPPLPTTYECVPPAHKHMMRFVKRKTLSPHPHPLRRLLVHREGDPVHLVPLLPLLHVGEGGLHVREAEQVEHQAVAAEDGGGVVCNKWFKQSQSHISNRQSASCPQMKKET